ncbi:MAG: helix-turn-helix domain-containing protein [Clostridiales bacterium]|nr:helix-turn-helix domain-containing protein [Clostridiales bacterium]
MHSGKEYFVIPIVLHSFNAENFDNYLIINISIDIMLQDSPAYRPTLNSHYYLLNNYTGQVYGETDAPVLGNISGSDMYNKITSGNDVKTRIGRKKYFLSAHSSSVSLYGYTHFCLVPSNDIYGANMRSTAMYCVVLVMLLIILAFLILSYTRRFISPIEKIAQRFNPHLSSRHENLFNEIELGITKIMAENNNVHTALPLVQEMYMINYLNSNKTDLPEETIALIETSLPFSKSAFIVLIIQIYPGKTWFEEFHNSDSKVLVSDLLNILKGLLSEKLDTFIISTSSNSFCTIINVDSDFDKNSLSAYMDEIYQILKYDSTYFDMYVGIGEMHEGLIGLKQSYTEANASINPVILDESHTADTIVTLSAKDENQLYSLIIRLHIDDSEEKIADICRNITNPTELKLMYSQILTVITKAMRNKNLFTIDDFDAYSDVISKSADDIYRLIKQMLARLKLYKAEAKSDDFSDDIVEYINMHFKNPLLSLNYLSEVFGISAKNISHLIKNKLGIGFSDYLTNLRIEYTKAKLSETNDNIDIIYSEAGFTSKQTFFRQFKKYEGKTPSEFRIDNKRN